MGATSVSQSSNNEMLPDSSCEDIDAAFPDITLCEYLYSETPLIGLQSLERFLMKNNGLVKKQVDHLLQSRMAG
jgi:hypothetical protein